MTMQMNEVELSIFRKELRKIFNLYDEDNSGTLDHEELKKLVDDLRIAMFLPPADEEILEKIFNVLDISENDLIELRELLKRFREIYQLLIEPGSAMAEVIKEDFEEMDFDDSGALEREELLPLFQRICERENQPECQEWQVQYIVGLIDEHESGSLDLMEVTNNYRQIIKELVKSTASMQQQGDPNKEDTRLKDNVFTKIEKGIQTLKNKAQAAQRKLHRQGETMIDTLNEKTIKMAKEKMSVTSLINPNSNLIDQVKRTQTDMFKQLSQTLHLKNKNGEEIDEERQKAYSSGQTANISPRKFLIDKGQTSINKSPTKIMLTPMKLQNFGPKKKNTGFSVNSIKQSCIDESGSSDGEMEAMIKAADEQREQMRIDEELEMDTSHNEGSRWGATSIDDDPKELGSEYLDQMDLPEGPVSSRATQNELLPSNKNWAFIAKLGMKSVGASSAPGQEILSSARTRDNQTIEEILTKTNLEMKLGIPASKMKEFSENFLKNITDCGQQSFGIETSKFTGVSESAIQTISDDKVMAHIQKFLNADKSTQFFQNQRIDDQSNQAKSANTMKAKHRKILTQISAYLQGLRAYIRLKISKSKPKGGKGTEQQDRLAIDLGYIHPFQEKSSKDWLALYKEISPEMLASPTKARQPIPEKSYVDDSQNIGARGKAKTPSLSHRDNILVYSTKETSSHQKAPAGLPRTLSQQYLTTTFENLADTPIKGAFGHKNTKSGTFTNLESTLDRHAPMRPSSQVFDRIAGKSIQVHKSNTRAGIKKFNKTLTNAGKLQMQSFQQQPPTSGRNQLDSLMVTYKKTGDADSKKPDGGTASELSHRSLVSGNLSKQRMYGGLNKTQEYMDKYIIKRDDLGGRNSPVNFGRMGTRDYSQRITSPDAPKGPLQKSMDLGNLGTNYKSRITAKSRWKISCTKQVENK